MSQSGKYGLGVTPPITVPDGGTGLTTITDHALVVGSGTAAMTVLAAATDGQLAIGSTGADPTIGNITSSGGTVTITNGAGTINIDVAGSLASQFDGDSGSAVPALGILTVAGGTNITTAGAGSTMTINLSGMTDHALHIGNVGGSLTSLGVATDGQIPIGSTGADCVLSTITAGNNIGITNAAGSITVDVNGTTQYALQVGDATNSLDSLAVGSATQILQSGGAGANPAWSTATYPATSIQGDILYSSADNTIISLAKNATATRYLANTGATNNPAWDQVDLSNGVTGTLPVSNGGVGAATLLDHGVLIGSGTAAVTPLAVGTDGQVLLGSTGADPVFATLSSTGSTIAYTPGAGTLNLETGSAVATSAPTDSGTATPSSGALTIAGGDNIATSGAGSTVTIAVSSAVCDSVATDSGTATPAAGVLTIAGGTNVTTSGAGSTVTINASGGGGGGLTWNETTGTSQAMAVDNGYILNNVSQVTATLPDTAALGSVVRVVGKGAGGWKIAQNASEAIIWDEDSSTTTGVGGYLESTDDYDAVELLCTVANTTWTVLSSKGNITIV